MSAAVAKASVLLLNRYRSILDQYADQGPVPAETSCVHLSWMCRMAASEAYDWPVDKLSRWLGFVQGVMAARGLITVSNEREFSRPLFHEAYTASGICPPETVG